MIITENLPAPEFFSFFIISEISVIFVVWIQRGPKASIETKHQLHDGGTNEPQLLQSFLKSLNFFLFQFEITLWAAGGAFPTGSQRSKARLQPAEDTEINEEINDFLIILNPSVHIPNI